MPGYENDPGLSTGIASKNSTERRNCSKFYATSGGIS